MQPEQFDRWKDFATRAARHIFAGDGRPGKPSGHWVWRTVDDFFDRIDPEDIVCIRSWDHTDPYPEGHPYYEDSKSWFPRGVGPSVSGLMHDYEWDWDSRAELLDLMPRSLRKRWDRLDEDAPDRADALLADWTERYYNPVTCCVRAGLDMTAQPSAGVLGFTAGDMRGMYPAGVPDWLFPPGEHLTYWPGGEPNGTFADLADEAVLAL